MYRCPADEPCILWKFLDRGCYDPHALPHFITAALLSLSDLLPISVRLGINPTQRPVRVRSWQGRRPSDLTWLDWSVFPLRFVPRTVIKLMGPPLKSACVFDCMFNWSQTAVRPKARPRLSFFIVFSPLEDTVDLFLEQKRLRPAHCSWKRVSPFLGVLFFYIYVSVCSVCFNLFVPFPFICLFAVLACCRFM